MVLPALADMTMPGTTAIIGCGNPNRSDDGAGPEVLRLLRESLGTSVEPETVRLLDAGTDGMAVMFAAKGCSRLIIVDACRSGSEAGAIFEVPGAEVEQPPRDSMNLHDFRWDHALFAGRRTFGAAFPEDVTVYLIEAQSVDFGIGLSPAVAAAAERVAAKIRARLVNETTASQPDSAATDGVSVRDGRLYLSSAAFARHFAGSGGVVLLRGGTDLMVLPVRQAAAGGYIAKIRNSAGDRVVTAPDFFRAEGLADDTSWQGESRWSDSQAALVLHGVFPQTRQNPSQQKCNTL